ncbi:uncharacterized protein LOC135944959 [Cloeon dipterum]|uniref:uncharacterized protein LOC135944959 n=1 Tax=Cloeon dipterum TaxID=197152 RepID=UPI00322089C7
MPQVTAGVSDEELTESVEALRQRLDAMKRLMAQNEKAQNRAEGGLMGTTSDRKNSDSIIDGNFLSVVFGVVLVLIISVSVYAFYNLYFAVLKKFPARPHSEL